MCVSDERAEGWATDHPSPATPWLLPVDVGERREALAHDAVAPAVELFDLECTDHVHPNGFHRILRGSLRNLANATLTDVTITAALVNEDGVEVLRVTDEITGAIGHGGERPFVVNFIRAPNVGGTCPIVSIDYTATVRYEVPLP